MPTTIDVSAMKDDSRRNDGLHHPAPEADRPQNADLLAALGDGSGADHSERGDADDQPEAHEALDETVEREAGCDGVVDDLLDRLGFHAAREECRFQSSSCIFGVDTRREREVVDRRQEPSRERALEGRPARLEMPTISSGAPSLRTPMTVSRSVRPV